MTNIPSFTATGNVMPYQDEWPTIAADAYVAPGAHVIGDVHIGARSSIWFNCVVRGDVNYIRIGEGTNIQDGTVVHVNTATHPTIIGDNVLVGHMALVHGCTLEDHAFVGMGSIVMDGAVIETDGMLAAGAMLTPGKRIPAGQLWAGRPAKYMRDLTPEQIAGMRTQPGHYAEVAATYLADAEPPK